MTKLIIAIVATTFIAATVFLSTGCKTKAYPATAETTYLSSPGTGMVNLAAVGYGANEKAAELDTYVTAFSTILFKGLPAFGALKLPMIDNEAKARSEHKAFFIKFFDNRGYLQFVTDQGVLTKLGKADQQGNIRVQKNLSINYDALRRHLEQEGVIRKFGY